MAVDQDATAGHGNDLTDGPEKRVVSEALKRLNAEDERLLRLWQESVVLQEPRLNSKGVAGLVRMAMVDEPFRARLVNDTERLLDELDRKVRISDQLPDGVTLRFLENTPDTLYVVLPPRAREMSRRSPSLRELLSSRTSALAWFEDNADLGDAVLDNGDGRDTGDPAVDPPIFVLP